MKGHLPAAKLKRDGRACTFNDSASSGLEHGFNARPLNVPIDGVCQHLLDRLTMCSIHDAMIALCTIYAIITLAREGLDRHLAVRIWAAISCAVKCQK